MKESWVVPKKVIGAQNPICLPAKERIGNLKISQGVDRVELTAAVPPLLLKIGGIVLLSGAIIATVTLIFFLFTGKDVPIVKGLIVLGILYGTGSTMLMNLKDESRIIIDFKRLVCNVVGKSRKSETVYQLDNVECVGVALEDRVKMRLLDKDEILIKEFDFSAGRHDERAVYILRLAVLICQRLKVPLMIDISVPSESAISQSLKDEYKKLR